jgi:hypothetical protein
MKKSLLFIAASLGTFFVSGQTTYSAQQIVQLSFQSEDGTNASAVAWNSDNKMYYTVIAGNETFPLETFSESGQNVYSETATIDSRGLWYNPKSKKIEGNCPDVYGYFSHVVKSNGQLEAAEVYAAGQNQPDYNSVGAFDASKKKVYFYSYGSVYIYNQKNGKAAGSILLKDIPSLETINSTTVIFTGRKGEELGVLDYGSNNVYLFDLKGNFKSIVTLPEGAVTHDVFRFSYANDKIWLYDEYSRTWTGYSF